MAFDIFFSPKAFARIQASFQRFGPNFEDVISDWLDELAEEAEQLPHHSTPEKTDLSLSGLPEFEKQAGPTPASSAHTWRDSTVQEVLVKLLAKAGLMRPPTELRAAYCSVMARNTRSRIPRKCPNQAFVLYTVFRLQRKIRIRVYRDQS